MTNRRLTIALIPTLMLAAAQAQETAVDLSACRALQQDSERLACYDSLAKQQAGQSANQATVPDVPEAAPPVAIAATIEDEQPVAPAKAVPQAAALPGDNSGPTQEELFGLNSEATKRSYEEAVGQEEMKELRATVTDIQPAGPGRIIVYLDNSQVWRQTTSPTLKVKIGDVIVIKKAAFGSFKMKKEDANASMKVTRVR